MNYRGDFERVGDLEVEGKLQLDDESIAECLCRLPDAEFTPDCTPDAREFRLCVELLNEVKDKLNALVGALT